MTFAEGSLGGLSSLLYAESLLEARSIDAALTAFDDAAMQGYDPDRCAAGRWTAHMLRGDFLAAWQESDAIRQRGAPCEQCLWLGQDLRGKRVVIRCLHGLGDAVQFLRYAPLLNGLADRVVWEVNPAMLSIANCFNGVTQTVAWGDPSALQGWEVQAEVMELPYIFRSQLRDLPLAENYMRVPVDLLRSVKLQMRKSRAPRVGLVWTAGDWNPSRSIRVSNLRPLFENSTLEFWNLQGGDAREQWRSLAPFVTLQEIPACSDDVLGLAAVISQLDLVITVDTLAAHLAGALGTPVWLMLQFAADWRWMMHTARSPWYPSMRIFRQPAQGHWPAVVDEVAHALDQQFPARRLVKQTGAFA